MCHGGQVLNTVIPELNVGSEGRSLGRKDT
jgi:hypothetical protein